MSKVFISAFLLLALLISCDSHSDEISRQDAEQLLIQAALTLPELPYSSDEKQPILRSTDFVQEGDQYQVDNKDAQVWPIEKIFAGDTDNFITVSNVEMTMPAGIVEILVKSPNRRAKLIAEFTLKDGQWELNESRVTEN